MAKKRKRNEGGFLEVKMRCPNCGAEIEMVTKTRLKLVKPPSKVEKAKTKAKKPGKEKE